MFQEAATPNFSDLSSSLFGSLPQPGVLAANRSFDKVILTGSGKGALAIILQYLHSRKILADKLDEVLVPSWLGYWVYNQINPYAFPAKQMSSRTKVLLVYHQYGFPQDMKSIMDFAREKNLMVIEDCAHALQSQYQGQPLGAYGDFAIYSFSKWFFCFALGGARSKFPDFSAFAQKAKGRSPFGSILWKDFSKWFYEQAFFSRVSFLEGLSQSLMSMTYGIYGSALRPGRPAQILLQQKLDAEIKIRQARYKYFLERVANFGIASHLEKEGITPYVIPIICPEDKNNRIVRALGDIGVKTGVYHFDINRNVLKPQFEKSVLIPCHSGLSENNFSAITQTVIRVMNS